MNSNSGSRGEFLRQAEVARALGSPFVASVLEAGERHLSSAPRTAALIQSWPGDPAAAALAMRFNAAIHALARRGRPRWLEALYEREHDDFDGALSATLRSEDDFIARWMRQPTQTNEVNRAGAIRAALMVASDRLALPFELLELGSSAGLNLNLAHYAYDLGGLAVGRADSPVQVAPAWYGAPPPHASVQVLSARGVDLHPLDVADEATRERLMSFVFADQPARAERLGKAIALARCHPPHITCGDAVSWLAEQLDVRQHEGQCRAIFHSMVLQYLSSEGRKAVTDLMAAAGKRATKTRPLAWISFEWAADRSKVQLSLTLWPTGETQQLALCHPYGAWIKWRG
jgi:hypothetical protein